MNPLLAGSFAQSWTINTIDLTLPLAGGKESVVAQHRSFRRSSYSRGELDLKPALVIVWVNNKDLVPVVIYRNLIAEHLAVKIV